MKTYKLYPLNAKAIRTSLTKEGYKVLRCRKGSGTTKNATYITLSSKDIKYAIEFLNNIGVVAATNKPLTVIKLYRI